MRQINSYAYYQSNQSLLSMLNSSKNDDSLLSQIISNNQTQLEETLEKYGVSTSSNSNTKYTSLEKSVTSLISSISSMDEENLKGDDETTIDKDKTLKAVNNFVTAYNTAMSSLTSCGGVLYSNFYTELKDAYSNNSQALNNIGISLSDEGKLTIDNDKLNEADEETIEAAIGRNASFTSSVASSINSMDDILDKALSYSSSNYTSTGAYLNF